MITPIRQNVTFGISNSNRYAPLQSEREGYGNAHINQPSTGTLINNTGIVTSPAQTSSLSTDDKLSIILSKIEHLEKNDQIILNMAAKQNTTEQTVKTIEKRLDLNTEYMKQLAYHSIDIEARSRRNNLIFYGLAECENEDTYELLERFFRVQPRS